MIHKPFDDWKVLGKIAFNPRGDYDPQEVYERLDIVYYNGSTWYCLSDGCSSEPSDTNRDWKIMARGYPEADSQVLGIRGSAEIEFRTGNVTIHKQDIGLDKVDNLSLKEIQQQTVSSLSFNGKKQKLKGDVDIPLVNGIWYNDKPLAHGNVHIHTIEGMAINGQKIKSGLIVTDMVTGLEINGRYKRGKVKLNIPEQIWLNGEKLKNHKGRVNIDVVEAVRINGSEPEKGIVDIEAVESVTVNNGRALHGHVKLSSVESLSINGSDFQSGNIELDVVHGVSINKRSYQRGWLDLQMVESLAVNGEKPQSGHVSLDVIESFSLNGKELGPKVDIQAVEAIELNNRPLKLDHGTASLRVAQEVLLNGASVLDEDGTANIQAVTDVIVNDEVQNIRDGLLELYIKGNGTVLYADCTTSGEDPIKELIVDQKAAIEPGSLLMVKFEQTNHAADVIFDINGTKYPVLITGEPVHEHNATALRKNGVFSFVFDGEAWNFHTGTTHPVSHYERTIPLEAWFSQDDALLFEIDVPSSKDDTVVVSYALGLTPEQISEINWLGIYPYAQEDNKITLGAFDLPQSDIKLMFSVY